MITLNASLDECLLTINSKFLAAGTDALLQVAVPSEWADTPLNCVATSGGVEETIELDAENTCIIPYNVVNEPALRITLYAGARVVSSTAVVKVKPTIEGAN